MIRKVSVIFYVILAISIDIQASKEISSDESLKIANNGKRVAKYDEVFWTAKFQKEAPKNESFRFSEGRDIQRLPIPKTSKPLAKETRSRDSPSREATEDESYEPFEIHHERIHKKKKLKKKFKIKKKIKKFLLPLLIAYKLKFIALVPIFVAGLILLVKTAGLAGFFFALFTAVMALNKVT